MLAAIASLVGRASRQTKEQDSERRMVPSSRVKENAPEAFLDVLDELESAPFPLDGKTGGEPAESHIGDGAAHGEPERPSTDVTQFLSAAGRSAWDKNTDALASETAAEDARPVDFEAIVRDRVVIMLLFHEVVRTDQVAAAWEKWSKQKQAPSARFWRLLLEAPGVDRARIFEVAAEVYGFQSANLTQAEAVKFLLMNAGEFEAPARKELKEIGVAPIGKRTLADGKGVSWTFATHDPSHPDVLRLVERLAHSSEVRYAPKAQVDALLSHAFGRSNIYLDRLRKNQPARELGVAHAEAVRLVDDEALEAEITNSALINLFEAMLVEAVHRGASDVHIFEHAPRRIGIYFRQDGELVEWHDDDSVPPEAFFAVAKDNALNVDRFERDTAQDGYMEREIDGAVIRFRVSVMPVSGPANASRSESIIIRVLDDRKMVRELDKLIYRKDDLRRFEWALRQPQGMILMTGPTGSGKSTTLVAALSHVITPKVNVLTIEDPVEYSIRGARQIKVGHKLPLEDALRYVLRHDPDVVMVGEMRDRETADLAIKLANTGHLTFSTLHTNDAPSAVSRLFKMGIEPFLIAYAINLVVAQRLIRTLCPVCKTVDSNPDTYLLRQIGFAEDEMESGRFLTAAHDESCPSCHGSGYSGRRALNEIMVFSPGIRNTIATAQGMVDIDALRNQAIAEGMTTLQSAAREAVLAGDTSVAELMRVVAAELRPEA